MEAAALYAFAGATGNPVVCFAHVTNQMASVEGDFEKGTAGGSTDALRVLGATARRWLAESGRAKPSADDGDGFAGRPGER